MNGSDRAGGSAVTSASADAAVRRVWVWHALFAVSLLIPTAITAADTTVALGPRTATVAIAVAWAGLYLAYVQRVDDWDRLRRRDAIGYFVLAIGFAAVLIVRRDIYFLVIYALYPQAFLFLGPWRWVGVAAVTGVLGVGAASRIADEGADAMLSVVASAAVAIAIGYVIEGIHGQSRSRGEALDDLARIHAATEAVAAARTPEAVAAALRTRLGEHEDDVTIATRPATVDHGFAVPLPTTRGETIVVTTDRQLTPEEQRRWRAIGPHVGVVLDNLRLARRARTAGVLEERERLARDVHDTLAQSLTSIVTQLEAADQTLPDDLTDVRRRMAAARDAARDGLHAARAFVRHNRPVELVDATFPEAIRHVAERWSVTTSIPITVTIDAGMDDPPTEHAEALVRVTQEALSNIYRHAAARHVDLAVATSSEGVTLEVRDDGVGFDRQFAAQRPDGTGFGLQSMRQRIEGLGGALTVDTRPGAGTTIRAELRNFGEATS